MKIESFVRQTLVDWDRNGNDQIDLKEGEEFRTHRRGPVGCTVYGQDFFEAADRNKDKVVDRNELTAHVKTFDQNGDGELEQLGWFTRLTHFFSEYLPRSEYGSANGRLNGKRYCD